MEQQSEITSDLGMEAAPADEVEEPSHDGYTPRFDRWTIQGTFALALLMGVGITVVLGVNYAEKSHYEGARPDDFVPLPADACRIDSAFAYEFYNRDLKASENIWNWQGNTTMCVEEIVYQVFVPSANESFLSNPLSHSVCKAPCDACSLQGPEFYIGVEANKASIQIMYNETTGTSLVFVDCWVSTVAASALSDYYGCDQGNERCYMLRDVVSELKTELTGIQRVISAAYAGYVADVFLFFLAVLMVRINRREAGRHVIKCTMHKEDVAKTSHLSLGSTGEE